MKSPKLQLKLSLIAVVVMSACTPSGAIYRPVVDGTPGPTFEADLGECRTLAQSQRQLDQDTTATAATAAVVGAALGAMEGHADDNVAEGAVVGMLGGAAIGGAAGASEASTKREEIVVECMKQRGHRVVG